MLLIMDNTIYHTKLLQRYRKFFFRNVGIDNRDILIIDVHQEN